MQDSLYGHPQPRHHAEAKRILRAEAKVDPREVWRGVVEDRQSPTPTPSRIQAGSRFPTYLVLPTSRAIHGCIQLGVTGGPHRAPQCVADVLQTDMCITLILSPVRPPSLPLLSPESPLDTFHRGSTPSECASARVHCLLLLSPLPSTTSYHGALGRGYPPGWVGAERCLQLTASSSPRLHLLKHSR